MSISNSTTPLLNMEDYYDEELYFPLVRSLLSGMGPESLYLQVNAIQWCFYYRNDVVCNYIDRIEPDPSTHELLVQIYFYGMKGTPISEECERRLEKILAINNEEIVAKLVETAMKSYEHVEYRDLSVKILEHYASDSREKLLMPIVCIVILSRRRLSIGIVALPQYI